jgi:hypothetical protein
VSIAIVFENEFWSDGTKKMAANELCPSIFFGLHGLCPICWTPTISINSNREFIYIKFKSMLYIIIFYKKKIKKSNTCRSSTFTLSPHNNNNEQNRKIVFSKYLIKYMWVFIQH